MKRNLLITFTALLCFSFATVAQDRATHPVSTAHISGVDGKTELVFEEEMNDSFTISVVDLTGKIIFTQQHPSSENGCTAIELPVENLRKGIYMVQVIGGDGKTKTLKLQHN